MPKQRKSFWDRPRPATLAQMRKRLRAVENEIARTNEKLDRGAPYSYSSRKAGIWERDLVDKVNDLRVEEGYLLTWIEHEERASK